VLPANSGQNGQYHLPETEGSLGRKLLGLFVALIALTTIAMLSRPAFATSGLVAQNSVSLAPGVTYVAYLDSSPNNVINVTHISPGAQVTIKAVSAATGGRGSAVASPVALCQQVNAVACINGDFFNSQGPVGGVLVDGKWLKAPTASQQQLWLNAANRFSIGAQPAQAVASIGATNYAILVPGQPISIPEHDVFSDGSHARTLVGWNAAGDRYLVTVQQGKGSSGMSLAKAADLMRRLGATTAVNEDGGGSSQMVVTGQLRSTVGIPPRAVANVWAVVANASPVAAGAGSAQWVIRPNPPAGG
jgi:hypothetical protein